MAMGEDDSCEVLVGAVLEKIPPRPRTRIEPQMVTVDLEQVTRAGSLARGEHRRATKDGHRERHQASQGRVSKPPNRGPNRSDPSSPNIPSSPDAMNRCLPGISDLLRSPSSLSLA